MQNKHTKTLTLNTTSQNSKQRTSNQTYNVNTEYTPQPPKLTTKTKTQQFILLKFIYQHYYQKHSTTKHKNQNQRN